MNGKRNGINNNNNNEESVLVHANVMNLSPNTASTYITNNGSQALSHHHCINTNTFEEASWNMSRGSDCGPTIEQDSPQDRVFEQGKSDWKEEYEGAEIGCNINSTCLYEQVSYGNNGFLVDEYPIDSVGFDAFGMFAQHGFIQGKAHWKDEYSRAEVSSNNNNTCFQEQVAYGNNGCFDDEYPIDLVDIDASGIFEQNEMEHQIQDLDESTVKLNAYLFDWKDSNCGVELTNFRWYQDDEDMDTTPILIDDLSRGDSLALFSVANDSIASSNDSIQMDPDFVSEFLADDDKSTASSKYAFLMDAEMKAEFTVVGDTY